MWVYTIETASVQDLKYHYLAVENKKIIGCFKSNGKEKDTLFLTRDNSNIRKLIVPDTVDLIQELDEYHKIKYDFFKSFQCKKYGRQ